MPPGVGVKRVWDGSVLLRSCHYYGYPVCGCRWIMFLTATNVHSRTRAWWVLASGGGAFCVVNVVVGVVVSGGWVWW